ncbi:MAG: methionine adenosyltransferase domain-containing protein [Deferrisomatales bacterium]|nr:methionine adenosyltransferase domain-containing protein [Deferrisomatales bacterium]
MEPSQAYAIGVAEPVSVLVRTFGTSGIPEEELVDLVRGAFALTPTGMIEALGLRAPLYLPTAAYGHFGRVEAGFPWEAVAPLAGARGAA